MYIPTRSISQGNRSQGQDDCTLRLTLHSFGRKSCFEFLDLSVDIKTILLTVEDLSCYLHSLVTASAACCKRMIQRSSQWQENRQIVRKQKQLLITWCDYWLWESIRGTKSIQKDRRSDGAAFSWAFFSLSRRWRSLGNSWVTEVSETASGWCMGISNAFRSEQSAALTRHMYSICITAEGASAKHLRGATFCYTYSCSLPC